MSTTHPVDSTFYACCNAIGRHIRDCTAENLSDRDATMPAMTNTTPTNTLPNVPLPPGTNQVSEWYQGARDCYGRVRTITASGWLRDDVSVFIHAIQQANGEITDRVIVAPELHPDDPLTSTQARQIGEALIAVADEFDAVSLAEEGAVAIYNVNSGAVAIVPIERVAETIRPWFPDASDAVGDAIAELQQTLNMGRCPDGLTAFLGITIDGDRYDLRRRAELRALGAMEVAR